MWIECLLSWIVQTQFQVQNIGGQEIWEKLGMPIERCFEKEGEEKHDNIYGVKRVSTNITLATPTSHIWGLYQAKLPRPLTTNMCWCHSRFPVSVSFP
jgi:hypothetical protein